MTPTIHPTAFTQLSQDDFREMLHEKLRQAVRLTLVAVLEEEAEAFVGAQPYQRSLRRRDRRNGYYTRDLGTSAPAYAGVDDLPVPRTRNGFHTQVFQRYRRRQDELDGAICDMFVRGVSTTAVGEVIGTVTGSSLSPSAVSRVFHTLEAAPAAISLRLCLR